MLYRILKLIVSLSIRIYYREIRILNRENLEHDGPMILIANHPNTLMDAWILGYINRRRVHYMAKATFFNSPFKRRLLNALGMIPINRKSDGVVAGVANKDSFEACYELLERGEILAVFPEGTSFLERRLRELKTGTARIALEVEKRSNGNLDLLVVPVGLNYVSADTFRGSVMVHVGKPISVDPFLEEYRVNQGLTAKKLTDRFRNELSRVFVTMSDDVKSQLVQQLTYLFESRYAEERGVKQSIGILKTVLDRLDEISVTASWKMEALREQANELTRQLNFFGIRPHFLDRPYRSTLYLRQTLQSYLFLLLTIPLFLFGFLHSSLPYYLIGLLVPKLTKEAEYHAPLSILLGLFLYPLTYAGWAIAFHALVDPSLLVLLIYIASLPLSGLFAHFFLRYMRHLFSKQQFSRFARSRKQVFAQLKAQRAALKELIFS